MAVTGQELGIYKLTAQDDAIVGRLKITYIRWVGATTADHLLQVTDGNDVIIFESEADGANFIDIHALFRWIDGIKVPDLDSGVVYVYTE